VAALFTGNKHIDLTTLKGAARTLRFAFRHSSHTPFSLFHFISSLSLSVNFLLWRVADVILLRSGLLLGAPWLDERFLFVPRGVG